MIRSRNCLKRLLVVKGKKRERFFEEITENHQYLISIILYVYV